MVDYGRDVGLERALARGSHHCYGMGLGILILDDIYPGFPGDVRNASAYPFPIQFEVVEGVDNHQLCDVEDKSACWPPILNAAKRLERLGCRAIAGECGLFAYFQQELAEQVSIPVFMSSLLQVPWAQSLVGSKRRVGILTGASKTLTDHHLESVGVTIGSNYVLLDVYDKEPDLEFLKLWSTMGRRSDPPSADYHRAERQMVEICIAYVRENADLGALVLECTGYPPFARAIQRAIDLPVFSWGTLLDYAYSVVVHRDFYGHV